MAGLVNAFANGVRNVMLSPEEVNARADVKRLIPVAKIAAVICTVVAFLLFAIFPNLFTAGLLGVTAYATYEVHTMANNLKEMLDDALIEFRAHWNDAGLSQMTKNAPIGRMIGEAMKAWHHSH